MQWSIYERNSLSPRANLPRETVSASRCDNSSGPVPPHPACLPAGWQQTTPFALLIVRIRPPVMTCPTADARLCTLTVRRIRVVVGRWRRQVTTNDLTNWLRDGIRLVNGDVSCNLELVFGENCGSQRSGDRQIDAVMWQYYWLAQNTYSSWRLWRQNFSSPDDSQCKKIQWQVDGRAGGY